MCTMSQVEKADRTREKFPEQHGNIKGQVKPSKGEKSEKPTKGEKKHKKDRE